jgi:hypothetical protein
MHFIHQQIRQRLTAIIDASKTQDATVEIKEKNGGVSCVRYSPSIPPSKIACGRNSGLYVLSFTVLKTLLQDLATEEDMTVNIRKGYVACVVTMAPKPSNSIRQLWDAVLKYCK